MKIVSVRKEYVCDCCRKHIGEEEAGVIEWVRGFGIDCDSRVRVIVQDYVAYGHTFSESNLCYDCKKKFLERALKELELLAKARGEAKE